MSLLGRLEDLSLTDIVQIVFLSRRTGVLELIDAAGRHTVLFRHGMVVNASGPDHSDLVTFLQRRGDLSPDQVRMIRQMEDQGVSCGAAVVEMNLMPADRLLDAIRERILSVVTPLLSSRDGEFNFILSEAMSPVDIEYEPETLLKDGGFSPQKIIGMAEGEKIKPLRGLEESLKAGQALRRGNTSPGTTPLPLDLGLGAAAPPAAISEAPKVDAAESGAAPPGDTAPPKQSTSKFKVSGGGLLDVVSPDAQYRNVILYERDPLVRVAAKRAFGKKSVKIMQYGSLDDVRSAMTELFRSNSFFVTFLELTTDDATVRVMQQVKHRNPRLPIVVIDREADLRRRHDLLRAGADLYLTRPPKERMLPETAQEELATFAEELVLFAERSFAQWEQATGNLGPDAGKQFYEMGEKESVDRSFTVLKQFINELSNPNDIDQVASTILHLSGEYFDRGALFIATDDAFMGLGGYGVTDGGERMHERIRALSIDRNTPSILSDVASSRLPHHGKIRRTDANVRLIEAMGNLLPTEVAALPIMHNEQGIGILYGDNAEHRAPISSMTGLEIFLSQAGYAFGNAVIAWQKAGGRGREGT